LLIIRIIGLIYKKLVVDGRSVYTSYPLRLSFRQYQTLFAKFQCIFDTSSCWWRVEINERWTTIPQRGWSISNHSDDQI